MYYYVYFYREDQEEIMVVVLMAMETKVKNRDVLTPALVLKAKKSHFIKECQQCFTIVIKGKLSCFLLSI